MKSKLFGILLAQIKKKLEKVLQKETHQMVSLANVKEKSIDIFEILNNTLDI